MSTKVSVCLFIIQVQHAVTTVDTHRVQHYRVPYKAGKGFTLLKTGSQHPATYRSLQELVLHEGLVHPVVGSKFEMIISGETLDSASYRDRYDSNPPSLQNSSDEDYIDDK